MSEFRMGMLAATLVVATIVAAPALGQQGGGNAAAPQPPGAAAQKDQLSDATVQKVGKALRQAATIRQQYSDRAQATKSQEQQQQLTEQAQGDMIKAINDQGLSVQQYNQVIQMAQADPSLKERLLSVAQAGH
jgi:GTP1/Obg family GTP-binding protein